jgi:tetratricopeptide (TPR) repeat protein
MMKTGMVVAMGVMMVPQFAAAQGRIERVARAIPSQYVEPTCDIKTGHFLVSSAATYLKSAGNAKDNTIRAGLNEKGIEVAERAIRENDQADNGAAWYYLGRNALQLGDIVAADSAFTRAAPLLPECVEDMKSWRRRAWSSLATPATEFADKGQADSAMALFQQSAIIAHDIPLTYYNLGVMFADGGQVDSAIANFARAQQAASTDTVTFRDDRNSATFNLAAMYQRKGDHAQAITELEKYISWRPDDQDARRALAGSFRAVGRTADAERVEKDLVAAAEASGTLSARDVMTVGITAFNDKRYQEAATAFEKVLAVEPYNNDAMFNLANTWFALKDGAKLLPVARKLVAYAPLSEENHRLLGQAFNMQQMQDSLMAVIGQMRSQPTNVTITSFAPRASGAALVGSAVGVKAERDGAELPATAVTLVVEFLAHDGSVVGSQEVAIPALLEAQTFDWKAEATGEGIVGWRYRVK